jgi:ABC-2 type transport system permease protein
MTTETGHATIDAALRTPGSAWVGQGSQFVGLYVREALRTFRNPWVLVITLVQPFMWLAFFGSSFALLPASELDAVIHAPPGTGYIEFLLPGVLATSMLSIGMFGSMSTIQDKRLGFMKRILLTPTQKATVYLAKATGSATRGLVQLPVMLVAAYVFGVRYHGNVLMWVGWVGCLVLLGLGFSAMFLAVTASSTDWQTPGVISNFITMPLMFASGALFPSSNYPPWMQTIAAWNPVGYTALFGRGVVVSGVANWAYLGYVALFAALMIGIGTFVAARYFKVE